jgi:hypothetical protein
MEDQHIPRTVFKYIPTGKGDPEDQRRDRKLNF